MAQVLKKEADCQKARAANKQKWLLRRAGLI